MCGKQAKTRAGGKIHLGFERQGRAPARRDLPHLEDPHFYGRVLQDRRDLPFPASKPKSITLSARFQRIQASRTQRKAKKHRCRPEIVLARSGAFSENVRKSAENTRFGIKVGTEQGVKIDFLSRLRPKPDRSPAKRVRFGKEEQPNEHALTLEKVGASDM